MIFLPLFPSASFVKGFWKKKNKNKKEKEIKKKRRQRR